MVQTRSELNLCMLLEFVGGVLAQFDDIFHGLVAVDADALFSASDQTYFGNG